MFKEKNQTKATARPISEEDQSILTILPPEWPLYRMYEVITPRGGRSGVIDTIAEATKDGRVFTVREFSRNREFRSADECSRLDNEARRKAFTRLQDRLDYGAEPQGLDPR